MRVLIVCSGNAPDFCFEKHQPFIFEQMNDIRVVDQSIEFSTFFLKGKGMRGYLSNIPEFKKAIKSFHPDVIHAHYGLCGLFANMQRTVPVVTTYHGSDINNKSTRLFSKMSMALSAHNIIVSSRIASVAGARQRYSVIPCGISLERFSEVDKGEARQKMGLQMGQPLVLFSSAFSVPVKNAPLAIDAVSKLSGVKLMELNGYSRDEVALLFNACDAALMTSVSEGSPQFIKEAMACGCPVVSVDVGDVKDVIGSTQGCYIAERNVADVSSKLAMALAFEGKTEGKKRIIELGYDSRSVASSILDVYRKVLG